MLPEMGRRLARLHVVAVFGLLAVGTARAASADIKVAVESPQNQTAAPQPFIIKGSAFDTASTANPGIAEVQVWAYPDPGSGAPGIFVGTATYGGSRPQVGQDHGAQFTNSGYELIVRGLAPKTYLFAVFARSSISNTWGVEPGSVTLQVQATPIMYTSTPTPTQVSHVEQPFTLGGFAIDFASASGSGVDRVSVVAFPTNGTTPIAVGDATYGISVPEVGTAFGDARFAASGFQITVSELPPGQYDLVSFAHSTVAAAFNNASLVRVNVDTPVPAPVISPPGGTYTTPQSVTITIPTDAEVRITRDGTTPTLTSESYAGGVLTVSVNTSLRARAFRAGWAPSPTVAADYTLVGAAPTILTAGGQYEAPVVVQISVPDGAAVRVTRDGSTPTSTSEEYGAPFEISQNTQLRAVAFKAGMAPSLTVGADYTFAAAIPTFSVPAGTYTGSISVALASATPGASLHWTLDGSDPTTSSAVYTTPIGIAAGVMKTLKARAFRTGWTPSAVAAASYMFELTGPVTISAQTSPAPNSAGWNNSDVTVTFTCTNASSCPAPVSVNSEGVGHVVSGSASNSDNSASVTVLVNIDRTPPVLSLTSPLPTPANGSLPLTGSLADGGSGVATVTCNGAPATVDGGTATCGVPVRYGTNAIVLQATDVAGNVASRGSQIFVTGAPSHLAISPSRRTLVIGETVLLLPRDDAGLPSLTSPTWSSSESAVASVSAGVVTALAVGTTIITASSGNLSAQATIQVLPAGPLPIGTARWAVTPPADYGAADVVVVIGGDDVTSFASIEGRWDPNAGEWGAVTETLIRGLDRDGETSYTFSAGLALNERVLRAIGDRDGGTILVVQKYPTSLAEFEYNAANGGDPVSLVRVSPSPDSPGWRYPLGGSRNVLVNSFALAPDGTLFGLRGRGMLFAVDSKTGLQRFQLAINGRMSDPRIDRTGSAVFIVTRTQTLALVTVQLYRVTTTGLVAQVTTLDEHDRGHNLGDYGYSDTLPGDDGGVLATWGTCSSVNNEPFCERRGRYVTATAGPMYNLVGSSPGAMPIPPSISAPGLIGYGQSGAINMMTGAQLWANPDQYAWPAAALEGGKVQYGSSLGSSTVYTQSGAVVSSGEPAFQGGDLAGNFWLSPLVIRGDEQVGTLVDGSFSAVVTTPAFLDPGSAFPTTLGGPQKTGAEQVCTPPELSTHPSYRQPRTFRYVFSDAFTPTVTNQPYSAEEKAFFPSAFEKWKFGGDRGYTGTFEPWVSTQPGSPNLFLGKGTMTQMDYAYPAGAPRIETRVWMPYFLHPGATAHPKAVYPDTEVGALIALLRRRNQQWNADPLLPDDMFGLYTHYALPTQQPLDKDYFSYTLVHEAGHLIGLTHTSEGCAPSTSVMRVTLPWFALWAPTQPTENDKKSLRKLLGIQ